LDNGMNHGKRGAISAEKRDAGQQNTQRKKGAE
jgi:hypothetical protein